MKKAAKIFAVALLISSVTALAPVRAQGSAIDPNGMWAWVVSLFTDRGAGMDPDG